MTDTTEKELECDFKGDKTIPSKQPLAEIFEELDAASGLGDLIENWELSEPQERDWI